MIVQEAQLMLTTCATPLAVSRLEVNKHGTMFDPLRLFAKHVTGTTCHKSVYIGYRYFTFILAVTSYRSDATGLFILRRYLTK